MATRVEYRLPEVGQVFGGAIFYPVAKTKDVLRFCRDFAETILDELVIRGGAFNLPDGVPVFGVAATVGSLRGRASIETVAKVLRRMNLQP